MTILHARNAAKKSFLLRIVTNDEKWIHYDNPKRKLTTLPNIHDVKVKCPVFGVSKTG